MKASHNPNADNSPSKAPAEQAMERGDWANALAEWKSWWAAAGEHANLDPDAMHDRAVCHFHCGDTHGAIADYKKALELDPEDAVTWNNLGLLEEQLGYQEQARERYRVSDELLGILNEHGIDPESSAPAFEERPASPTPISGEEAQAADEDAAPKTFWGEIQRTVWTKEGRRELWTFVTNGFTLRG